MVNLNYPPFVHWEVTPECNHNCIHCYNYWRKDSEKCDVNLSEEHYLSIAEKIAKQKPNTVVITGGEPLLVFNKIKSSIALLKLLGINISINSNAVLVNDEVIDLAEKYNLSFFVSFPCYKKEVCDFIVSRGGALERILKSLDLLKSRNIRFSLNIVASKANIDYIEDTVKFLKERYDIKKIYITRVGKPVNSTADFDKYLLSDEDLDKLQDISVRVKKVYGIEVDTGCPYTLCSINSQEAFDLFGYRKICTAGKTSYAIDSFGNMKACPRDSKMYGNILDEKFEDVWKKMNEWRDGSLLPPECKKCNVRVVCQGGCRVDAFPFTGKMNSLDTTARLSNLPVKYSKVEKIAVYPENSIFKVNEYKVVSEDCGYRISHNAAYVFITKELYDFLHTHLCFMRKDIETAFSIDSDKSNAIIHRLVKNGIIHLERR